MPCQEAESPAEGRKRHWLSSPSYFQGPWPTREEVEGETTICLLFEAQRFGSSFSWSEAASSSFGDFWIRDRETQSWTQAVPQGHSPVASISFLLPLLPTELEKALPPRPHGPLAFPLS